MITSSSEVFRRYFAELDKRGIPYVILHGYADYPDMIASDVDHAVPQSALDAALRCQLAAATASRWQIGQFFQHEICAYCTVFVNPDNPQEFLRLDICSDYVRNGCHFLSDDDLLAGRQRYRDFSVPAPAAEFAYVLAKAFAKSKSLETVLPRLRQLAQQDPGGCQQRFVHLFGLSNVQLAHWLNQPTTTWEQLGPRLHQRHRYRLTDWGRELLRRGRRLVQPTGCRIALLGLDGVGKTTVIASIQDLLANVFAAYQLEHFCPEWRSAGSSAPVTEPHRLPPRSTLVCWGKVLFYFALHWADYLAKQRLNLARKQLVVFDRMFEDQLIDPRRYRLQRSAWLVRLLRPLLPRFDRVFVLDADPVVIHKRKSELPVAELERQRAALQTLAANHGYVLVSAEQAPDRVAQVICRGILDLMASRFQQRRPFASGKPNE